MIESGHPLIALDLSEVDFIDSSGLGAIVSVLKQLDGRGDLVIVGAKPAVMNLFRLTRMDKVFRMYRARGRGGCGAVELSCGGPPRQVRTCAPAR